MVQLMQQPQAQVTLSQQQRLGQRLLQLPAADLAVYLARAAADNPLLHWERQEALPLTGGGRAGGEEQGERWDREVAAAYFQPPTLTAYRREQLLYAPLSHAQRQLGEAIIASLDRKGFLREKPSDLAAWLGVTVAQVTEVTAVIQNFDPPGVATAGVKAGLLKQLTPKQQEYALCCTLIQTYLPRLDRDEEPALARELGLTPAQVRRAVAVIRGLRPYPAQGFAGQEENQIILPDVVVQETEGVWEVLPWQDWRLGLTPHWQELWAAGRSDPVTRAYLQQQQKGAAKVLQAVAWRQQTLVALAAFILREQQNFLQRGPSCLRPLSLGDAAAALAVHPSTVSRALQGKHFLTPRGLLAAKCFFSAALPGTDGAKRSNVAVRERLRQLLAQENPAQPYSDRQLAALLTAEGMSITRRTVAKYRAVLGIPGQARRRR